MDAQLRNYDRRLERTYQKAIDNLSKENFSLLEKYDNEMATLGLKKSTRAKQLSIIVAFVGGMFSVFNLFFFVF